PRVVSPSITALLSKFRRTLPTTKAYTFDYFHSTPRKRSWEEAYGESEQPLIAWDKANVILALESDFLGKGSGRVSNVRRYASRRDGLEPDHFNRLYSVEGSMSPTGMSADHRLSLRPDLHLEFVFSLLHQLVIKNKVSKYAQNAAVRKKLESYDLDSFVRNNQMDPDLVKGLVSDLQKERGSALVHAGDSHSQDLHQAVHFLNEVLDAKDLFLAKRHQEIHPLSGISEWESLVSDMKAGKVGAVIHCDVNPVFHLPVNLGYEKALQKVPMIVSMVEVENETSRRAHYVLPMHHLLESWGDAKVQTDIIGLQQPVVSPLFNSRQMEGILLGWQKGEYKESDYHDFLRDYWRASVYPVIGKSVNFTTFWNSALHDGFVTFREKTPPRASYGLAQFLLIEPQKVDLGKFAVHLHENYTVGDGKLSNNGWLLELPHPVSKVVWDNYAAISADTAKKLQVEQNSLIDVQIGSRSALFPVFIQPGMADQTISIELGYGRRVAGRVGTNVGHDASSLLTKDRVQGDWIFSGSEVKKRWGSYELVSTQEHGGFNIGSIPMLAKITKDAHLRRGIIHESTLADYRKHPDFVKAKMAKKRSHVKSLYTEEHEYKGQKWGMAIDLNKCTGCNECIVACSAENNVPVVGKEQVRQNREMHWIRIDRYYSGTIEKPVVSLQPMLCQQCDNATCENVCPVAATTHTPDGLNGMAYNRCVGTRYCAANCPYKVRRFNFLNFRRHVGNAQYERPVATLAHNPEVTVRSRGVMEKCSFCVQRIYEGRQLAKEEKREFKGAEITVACQDACNASAIIFGDTNDPKDPLRAYQDSNLEYKVLEELMVRPNITYLAKLRNAHEEEKS
ncbi:4Fe-4S dicluster domain-containing protein, partial [bacterium]|nr:4Fe-4S dicluster domain-containing protein [bacterium]